MFQLESSATPPSRLPRWWRWSFWVAIVPLAFALVLSLASNPTIGKPPTGLDRQAATGAGDGDPALTGAPGSGPATGSSGVEGAAAVDELRSIEHDAQPEKLPTDTSVDTGTTAGTATADLGRASEPTEANPTPSATEIPVVVTDVSALVSAVSPGVVSVTAGAFTSSVEDLLDPVFVREGIGTGIVIDNDGHILTNYHVITSAEAVKITSTDGQQRQATVIGEAPDLDLALLKVSDPDGLVALPLGDSSALDVGNAAIAIGNAFGLDETKPTVSVGIVSAMDRTIQATNGRVMHGLLQTDAAINPGNSGGPLLNQRGEVVGINSAIVSEGQNLGFAIAIDDAKPIIEAFKTGEGGPYLGVSLSDNSAQLAEQTGLAVDYGAVIAATAPGPGLHAGLRPGDVVVRVADSAIDTADDLAAFVDASQPGEVVEFEIYRGADQLVIRVEIGQRPTLVEKPDE